jgi:hypothetical protein
MPSMIAVAISIDSFVDAFSAANRKSIPDQVRDRLSPENALDQPLI